MGWLDHTNIGRCTLCEQGGEYFYASNTRIIFLSIKADTRGYLLPVLSSPLSNFLGGGSYFRSHDRLLALRIPYNSPYIVDLDSFILTRI